jgi:hypothetical protein
MDWKRRSDQPRARYEPDEGDTFEDDTYIDASGYAKQHPQDNTYIDASGYAKQHPQDDTPDHARYDQATIVDPVFAERGRMRRERQTSSFSTPRLGAATARLSGRRNLLPLLALGLLALVAIPLLAWLYFRNDGGGGTPVGQRSPTPTVSASTSPRPAPSVVPSASLQASFPITPSASLQPSPSVAPSASPVPGTFVVTGTGTQGLFLRKDPSTNAAKLATLPEGTRVQGTADVTKDAAREWRKVRTTDGREGWVATEFLKPAP